MKRIRYVGGLVLALWACVSLAGVGCSRREGSSAAGVKAAAVRYHCPMHPQIIAAKPGECPICGMALVVVGEGGSEPSGAGITGLAAVTVAPEVRERIGLTVGMVEARQMTQVLRLPARIVADEARQTRVTSRLEGYVETLYVSVTGQLVKPGDPLLSLYSPQLAAAGGEYRIALRSGQNDLIEASQQRLRTWGLSPAQLQALQAGDQAAATILLPVPAAGVVTERSVVAGQKVGPGDPLMVVVDCSTVWALADVSESDIPLVKTGLTVSLTFPNWPGKRIQGVVSFIPPELNPETRTLKIRIEVPNPDLSLKLGMYAEGRLEIPLGSRTSIPETAVMQTGTQVYAFRDDGDGKLTPVEIRVGIRSGGYYEVLSGLEPGARVVTSANFLVDSESSIRAALEAQGN